MGSLISEIFIPRQKLNVISPTENLVPNILYISVSTLDGVISDDEIILMFMATKIRIKATMKKNTPIVRYFIIWNL